MSPVRDAPRLLGEAFDHYARYTLVALVLIPVTPDVVTDFVDGAVLSGSVRIAVIFVLMAVAGVLLWRSSTRSARQHAAARRTMNRPGRYDILVLPLSLKPEYRATGREHAESVPELLIDGADALNPSIVVLVRTPQIDQAAYSELVRNLTANRQGMHLVEAAISDATDPVSVYHDVHKALHRARPGTGISIAGEVAGGKSIAVDLTGGTALVSLGLARLAHDLDAGCIYVSGRRGENGRFVVGSQDRHLVALDTLFAPPSGTP